MLNRATCIGWIGKTAELRDTAGGPVATFSIGMTDRWIDKRGVENKATEWMRVVLWGGLARRMKPYLLTGVLVFVEGKLVTREWVGKDGYRKRGTEIHAITVRCLTGGKPRDLGKGMQQVDPNPGPDFDAPIEPELGF